MSKPKYSFNPESLSYDQIKLSPRQKIFKFLRGAVLLLSVSFVFLLILSLFFDTPGEKIQKRENKQLLYQYELLNQKVEKMEQSMDEIQQHDDNIYRLIFGIDPVPENIRKAGVGGSNPYKELEQYSKSDLLIETSKKIDNLTRRMVVQTESYDNIMKLVQDKEKFLASIPAISPIADRNLKRFASGYGYRIHPIYRTLKMHKGIDLTAPTGTKVYATGGGKVISAGYAAGGYGIKVIIDHGYGYKTLYAHLNKVNVKVGKHVARGDVIGEVGSTGRSTAPHLHYEVRKNDQTENPVNYYYTDLTPEEYEEMINVSSQMTMSFD
ncbi:MAG: M23 family metallopeptidase [Salinivirgaceae bacterium]|nr:M23 family metallopeptidase [Salinivirgaceae bacterium]